MVLDDKFDPAKSNSRSRVQTVSWEDWPSKQRAVKKNLQTNYLAGIQEVCDKEKLADLIEGVRRVYPNDVTFAPRSWCLPRDQKKFCKSHSEAKQEVLNFETDEKSGQAFNVVSIKSHTLI